ncbi:hypothetical protein ACXN5S_06305 [Pseudoroseicyclus sp. H15]
MVFFTAIAAAGVLAATSPGPPPQPADQVVLAQAEGGSAPPPVGFARGDNVPEPVVMWIDDSAVDELPALPDGQGYGLVGGAIIVLNESNLQIVELIRVASTLAGDGFSRTFSQGNISARLGFGVGDTAPGRAKLIAGDIPGLSPAPGGRAYAAIDGCIVMLDEQSRAITELVSTRATS